MSRSAERTARSDRPTDDGSAMYGADRPNVCIFCGSRKTVGGMGMRGGQFSVTYCKRHKRAAGQLWSHYLELLEGA